MDSIRTLEPRMQKTCTLSASGYRVDFRLRLATLSPDHAEIDVTLYLGLNKTRCLIASSPSFISFADLQRLIDYLEAHLVSLESRPETESPVFVPLELGFQVQALGGELLSPDDGAFTLRTWVNAQPDVNAERVYVGCEGTIGVNDVRAFITSVATSTRELRAHSQSSGEHKV